MPTRESVARQLADLHFSIDPSIHRIFRYVAANETDEDMEEPIKLLEISEETLPAGIIPIYFGPRPAKGFPYSMVIVEITPEEHATLGVDLTLPMDWAIQEEIVRSPIVQDQHS